MTAPASQVPQIEVMEERPGGAGNVAMNTVSLGAKATLVGVTGVDEAADSLKQRLDAHGVKCLFTRVDGFTTVTKLRVLSQHQQLIRLDFEDRYEWLKAVACLMITVPAWRRRTSWFYPTMPKAV